MIATGGMDDCVRLWDVNKVTIWSWNEKVQIISNLKIFLTFHEPSWVTESELFFFLKF